MKGLMTKKERKEYASQVRKRAKKFKLKNRDAHNLYDLYWMATSPQNKELIETLKLNKMDKWFHNFTYRIEKIISGNSDRALKKVKDYNEK